MDWANLPDHIVISILTYLPLADRCQAGRVCKSWAESFKSSYVWTSFDFSFKTPENKKYIVCVEQHGQTLQNVCIVLDQSLEDNRTNACMVLAKLSRIESTKLRRLKVKFTGENPLFYAGQEFLTALYSLFSSRNTPNGYHGLIDIDLSGLYVGLDDKLIEVLAENHAQLERLNIQNKMLISKVSPNSILHLVRKCQKLRDLQLFQSSISEDAMMIFIEDGYCCLEHISLFCRREEKYRASLSNDTWEKVGAKLPRLRVTLWFDHTCPLHKVSEIMKPSIPCKTLRLETFTRIYDEINQATTFYAETLEKLIVSTTSSVELNEALLTLSATCSSLSSLHVFCLLKKETVEKIFEDHPVMKEKGWYTLKYIMEPHPWTSGGNC